MTRSAATDRVKSRAVEAFHAIAPFEGQCTGSPRQSCTGTKSARGRPTRRRGVALGVRCSGWSGSTAANSLGRFSARRARQPPPYRHGTLRLLTGTLCAWAHPAAASLSPNWDSPHPRIGEGPPPGTFIPRGDAFGREEKLLGDQRRVFLADAGRLTEPGLNTSPCWPPTSMI